MSGGLCLGTPDRWVVIYFDSFHRFLNYKDYGGITGQSDNYYEGRSIVLYFYGGGG